MTQLSEFRLPWWGVLVQGDASEVAVLLGRALRMVEHAPAPTDFEVGRGDGWTAIVSYRREEPNYEVADALRSLTGSEVIVLEWGEAPWVHRWDDEKKRWFFAERDISALAAQLKIEWPWPKRRPGRATRFAALIEGVPPAEVLKHAELPSNVIATPRGTVVLEEERVPMTFEENTGVVTYKVTRFLDTNEFLVMIVREGEVSVFGANWDHAQLISDVEGETEPKAILRRLGIPENYFFPPTTN